MPLQFGLRFRLHKGNGCTLVQQSRLGMSVTTQSGSGRQYVGSGRQYVTGS